MTTLRFASNLTRLAVLFMAFSFAFLSCKKEQLPSRSSASSSADGSKAAGGTIVDIAIGDSTLTALVAAVIKTNLAGTLSDPSVNFTVFAPDDNAFSKLPAPFNNAANINAITAQADIDFLTSVLLYHVLGSEVFSSQIAEGRSSAVTLKTSGALNDNTLYFSRTKTRIEINGSSLVTAADIDATNGVIHKVKKVLLYPTQTIADGVTSVPDFSALVAGLVKTNLVGLFAAAGDYTVFAPTDGAFSKLPAPYNNAENISNITDQAQIDALSNILRYHVTSSRYFIQDLGLNFNKIETLADAPNNQISVNGIDRRVRGNGNIGSADIKPGNLFCTNGVVQIINKVLIP